MIRAAGVKFRALLAALLFVAAMNPASLFACAACYGQSDSPMAKGMNWGIFCLLAVIVPVLGTFAGFFVYLAKRAAASNQAFTSASSLPDYQSPATTH